VTLGTGVGLGGAGGVALGRGVWVALGTGVEVIKRVVGLGVGVLKTAVCWGPVGSGLKAVAVGTSVGEGGLVGAGAGGAGVDTGC
jgi:hypothetical protein